MILLKQNEQTNRKSYTNTRGHLWVIFPYMAMVRTSVSWNPRVIFQEVGDQKMAITEMRIGERGIGNIGES